MSYKVTLPKSFPYEARRRAGITITRQDGYEGDLTADQLKAIKADPLLTVSGGKAQQPAEPSTDWKLADLKAYAAKQGIDAEKCTSKQQALDLR